MNRVVVKRSHIIENLRLFTRAASVPVAPVIKSNAYGHGLQEVGSLLDKTNVPFLCVNSLEEAFVLRRVGVRKHILVLGYTQAKTIKASKPATCAFMIGTLRDLKTLSQSKTTFHLKIDSGMRRQGILPGEVEEAIKLIKKSRMHFEGVFSHFADADGESEDFTQSQVEVWNAVSAKFKKEFPRLKYTHLAATTGIRLSKYIEANVARLGVGLYGMNASHQKLPLKPALDMHSVVASVRDLLPGEKIGYNGTFTAKKRMRVATIPVGYFEGVDRRLSNKGSFIVRGSICPIVGRVSMNMTTVDVTHVKDVVQGDDVLVISSRESDPNSVESLALLCGTISYDMLVHIAPQLPRILD